MSKYFFGIDLGTTNSAISYIEEGKEVPTIIELENGKTTIPSCLMIKSKLHKDEHGCDVKFVVGEEAYENRFKDNAIYSIKRLMGTENVITLRDEEAKIELLPEEVSMHVLKELVKQAEKTFGEGTIKDVVITVPAYFNNKQRIATKKAGELAGLNVIKIINEPTSASILYGLEKSKRNETIMTYDLGGGTFDVTVLNVIKNIDSKDFELLGLDAGKDGVDIIYSDGDTRLGGDDLDEYMWELFKEKVKEEYNHEVSNELKKEIILKLEKCKKNGGGVIGVSVGEEKKYVTIDEDLIVKATKYIFDKTMTIVRRCIKNGSVSRFDKIVLVGGSTKNKYLQDMLAKEFPLTEVLSSYKPDESVALGACVQALADDNGFVTINDIVPLSIGIKIKEGTKFYRSMIINHGDSLPCSNIKTYKVNDNNGSLELEVYQGDSRYLEECVLLGKLTYTLPQDAEFIKVRFLVDLNGLLTCSVITDNGEESLKLSNIFNTEEEIEIDLEDKKYRRWMNLLKDKNATEKEIGEFTEHFKKGTGQNYIKMFVNERGRKTNMEVKLPRIGEKNK